VTVSKRSALSADELSVIDKALAGRGQAVPVAYAVGTTQLGSKIVIGGADLKKLAQLNSWWSMSEAKSGNALVGGRVDETTHGAAFAVAFGKRSEQIRPAVVFHSGSDDDSRVYVPLEDFVAWTGVRPATVLLRAEGRPQQIRETIAALNSSLPGIDVQPVRQITQAQSMVVTKTRSVVLASSAVVMVLIMLCMIATFTSSVLERRKDFAVMKALGASNRAVNMLFAAEAALLALVGAVAGFIVGSGIAFWIGRANFGAAIRPEPALLLPVMVGSVLLALIAATAPLRVLQQIQPAGILRGE
jgi:putative ABC transport system permease protein